MAPEPSQIRSPVLRVLWATGGLCCVGIGAIGVVVPGLPTTVFFIAAAACFTRSSPRLERWVLELPGVGPAVQAHRAGLGMPRKAKVAAVVSVILFSTLALIVVDKAWFRVVVGLAAMTGVAVIVLRVPTRETVEARLLETGLETGEASGR